MPSSEFPLFITDPSDGSRRMVGTMQTGPDGSVCWFRRITAEHVMREGTFGFDASTFDAHFAGRAGTLKLQKGPLTYTVDIQTFEQYRKEKDHGHGRQYFLAFQYWKVEGQTVRPERQSQDEPPKRLVFGEHIICPRCHGTSRRAKCVYCNGNGIVSAKGH